IIKKIERARVKMEQIKPRSTLPRGKKEGGLTVKLFKGHYTSKAASAEPALGQNGPNRVAMHFLRDVDPESLVDAWSEGFAANNTPVEIANSMHASTNSMPCSATWKRDRQSSSTTSPTPAQRYA
ncbi:MAG: hypothetical protein ACREYE_08635, partial [Gammaproteobacteria bacterium]